MRINIGTKRQGIALAVLLIVAAPIMLVSSVQAITAIPVPTPATGTYGLEATKKQAPPATPPTISTPGSGGSYGTSPITVSGVCITGLIIQVYNNGVLAGSVMCANGSFTIQVSLFSGQNDLTAIQFDDLDQASPVSNMISVTFNNATPGLVFATQLTLTTSYGRRAANPGTQLTWPLVLSGGTGPYAFSIDWGDGTAPELKSQALSGNVTLAHTYKQSGLYRVTVKVTDANGQSAFIQLVALANGQPKASDAAKETNTKQVVTKVLWIPAAVCVLLLIPTYLVGRRSMLVSLRRKMEKDLEKYKDL